jgi:hypothetical protein
MGSVDECRCSFGEREAGLVEYQLGLSKRQGGAG